MQDCSVLLVGSSVAYGTGATNDYGWSSHLAAALAQPPYQLSLINAAVPGRTAQTTLGDLEAALAIHNPRVVLVGLSLANEGLRLTFDVAQAENIAQNYLSGLRAIAQRADQADADVIIGGVYGYGRPGDNWPSAFLPFQAQTLFETNATLGTWEYPYVDFLSTTATSDGRWRTGLAANAGHPNDSGSLVMSEAIDVATLFAPYSCTPSPPPSPRVPPFGPPPTPTSPPPRGPPSTPPASPPASPRPLSPPPPARPPPVTPPPATPPPATPPPATPPSPTPPPATPPPTIPPPATPPSPSPTSPSPIAPPSPSPTAPPPSSPGPRSPLPPQLPPPIPGVPPPPPQPSPPPPVPPPSTPPPPAAPRPTTPLATDLPPVGPPPGTPASLTLAPVSPPPLPSVAGSEAAVVGGDSIAKLTIAIVAVVSVAASLACLLALLVRHRRTSFKLSRRQAALSAPSRPHRLQRLRSSKEMSTAALVKPSSLCATSHWERIAPGSPAAGAPSRAPPPQDDSFSENGVELPPILNEVNEHSPLRDRREIPAEYEDPSTPPRTPPRVARI